MVVRSRTVIMGVGNILLADEGIGVHAVQALREEELPANVEIIDGGTAALDALQLLGDVDRLIVVDAVKGGGEPGTIYQMPPQGISKMRSERISLHQATLLDALDMSKLLGSSPQEVVIVGIEPKVISVGLDLSPELRRRLRKIVEVVRRLV